MLIFLLGMMGSGKSTLGKELAEKLGYTFLDLDAVIEEREQRTIAQIFEQEGQERFRELEHEALQSIIANYSQAIVATGGGTPCFFDNMALMNAAGETIFLDVPPEILAERLSQSDLNLRPLLTGKTQSELISFLGKTLAERRQFYVQAKHLVAAPTYTSNALLALLRL
ncbi:shikimate kinase [Pontibacter sp. KCTC 32443]|uniref:shikimate kinase n=1 Tax=Pontibacter TaxID=323449 RepID=UPI00164E05BC|nr:MULTISPECIES: shikimate kinase [Pontibacter]MBC5774362.1 shikimate kinase [Pontibacter sp. KCTC 32443]